MKLGYTEFSFGYVFTENLIRSSAAPSTAPYFPNLVEEGQLGFDLRIDLPAMPLFVQFKLPELMTRATAFEISKHHLPLMCNFFRMSLMRRDKSDQHRLLLDLESLNPGAVFYASAMLSDMASFNNAYNAAAVHRRSALFSPVDIGPLPDNKNHVVSYRDGAGFGFFCSEPQQVKLATFENILPRIADELGDANQDRLGDVAARTLAALREVQTRRGIRVDEGALRQRIAARSDGRVGRTLTPEEREVAEELFVSREIARIGLGVEMIIAQPRG